ncbi:hypothetical protein V6N13_073529 [Hibiscus sabdariffa]|uniref:Uncharacterized protein n=1 Tax=Hibiscus sabdariffa TaxID=183260 RepID=A0ABR2B225_9ROSI
MARTSGLDQVWGWCKANVDGAVANDDANKCQQNLAIASTDIQLHKHGMMILIAEISTSMGKVELIGPENRAMTAPCWSTRTPPQLAK